MVVLLAARVLGLTFVPWCGGVQLNASRAYVRHVHVRVSRDANRLSRPLGQNDDLRRETTQLRASESKLKTEALVSIKQLADAELELERSKVIDTCDLLSLVFEVVVVTMQYV